MERVRYEVDPHNRLVVESWGKKSALPMFRRVLDGSFKAGRDNELSYHVKSPSGETGGVPGQIKFKGSWAMGENHTLKFVLDRWQMKTDTEDLTLSGEVLAAGGNSLLFGMTTKTKSSGSKTYAIELKGAWQADRFNRLVFMAKREAGKPDALTFDGIWEFDRQHRIVYSYHDAGGGAVHEFTVKGNWRIGSKRRLLYAVDGCAGKAVDFRVSYAIFRENYIRYELGVGTSGARRDNKILTLFGKWRIKKNLGLTFRTKYRGGIRSFTFAAEASLSGGETVKFKLKKDMDGNKADAELEISRRILKGDGRAFMKVLRNSREKAVLVGAGFGW